MVPLIMSTPREDNPGSIFEEFGTHLSLYDDSFHFVEKSVAVTSAPSPVTEDSKGPLPPSVFYPAAKNADDASGQVKVKRKCGRPRNPIPRHKRESHINAEHRRRGKIQDGFRTLKGIVPKYEQSSGRDSKADILFKAVDYCKLLQNDIKEIGSSIEALKAEKDALNVDIKNYKTVVPDLSLFDGLAISLDDRYTDYVQCKSKESWTFGTFKVIMRPLFESYKLSVRGESLGEFLRSVVDWAATSLSLSNLRTVCLTTLRDVPSEFEDVSQFKDGHVISSYGATSSTVKSTISDSNNNRCPDRQSLTPELFSCQNIAANSGRAGWNQTADVHNHTFENTQLATSRSSSVGKGGPCLNMQYPEDLVSYTGANLDSSNIFGDLYYNLGNDLHHHQINLARAGMNHWPNLHFRQQSGHYFQNSHLPNSRNYSDFRDGHQFWGSQHQQLSQHLVGDHNLAPGHYQQPRYPLAHRDFRYDLSSPREGSEPLSTTVPYLSHPTSFLDPDHNGRKRLSQSSSESEGSLLNMEMFARKATESLGEHEKYPQLSPSTDSCVSSGSSAYIPSPGVLNGRNADYACSYRSTSSLDNFKQIKSVPHERLDNLGSQLALSSSIYRDIFGIGAAELQNNSVNRLDEQQNISVNRLDEQSKTCVNRYENNIGSVLCVNSSKSVPTVGCRQPSIARHDCSSLLGEMLAQQQSSLRQTLSVHHSVDPMLPAPTHHTHVASNTHPLTSSTTDKATDFVHELVKKESAYMSSLPPEQSPDYPYATAKDQHLHLSTKGQSVTSFHPQTIQPQKDGLALDVKNPGWLYPYAKSQTTSDCNASTKLKLERSHLLTNSSTEACYFEKAHQKLLKSHYYSIHNSKDTEAQLPDLTQPQKESCQIPKQETDIFNCKTNPAPNKNISSSAAVETSAFLDKSSQLIIQPQTCSAFMEATSRHKIGRKSSFEDDYTAEQQLEAVNACKKICQREGSVKTSAHLLMARHYGDAETVAQI